MGAPSSDDLRVERLTEFTGRGFEALYNIYSHTIAASEQKARPAVEAMTESRNYRLFIASVGEMVVGFSIFYLPDNKDFALLEYMAVDERSQGHGIGSKMFLETVDTMERIDGPCPVLLEVDSDREITLDHADRLRRIKFYRNLGCRRIRGLAYVMPSVGRGAPPQMDIYVFRERDPKVPRADLKRWLTTIYEDIYKRPQDDPRIEEMLSPLGDSIPLE
jgi:ribosomal protein S18 acetylase RimI-like enzyme